MKDFAYWNRDDWRAFVREVNSDLSDAEFSKLWDQFTSLAFFKKVETMTRSASIPRVRISAA